VATFHTSFGWVAIGLRAAIAAMVVQVLAGVYLYQQDERPGSQHMFYGFVILFTLTFGYVYRWQLSKHAGLRWGLFLLFVMGLGIRGVMTFGESF
jgi:hypothetical protein